VFHNAQRLRQDQLTDGAVHKPRDPHYAHNDAWIMHYMQVFGKRWQQHLNQHGLHTLAFATAMDAEILLYLDAISHRLHDPLHN
jgi:hypothetical protein